jgi:hypothetical protein
VRQSIPGIKTKIPKVIPLGVRLAFEAGIRGWKKTAGIAAYSKNSLLEIYILHIIF